MNQEKHVGRGIIAGLAAGLVASWVMNEFMTGPGQELQRAVQSPEENERDAIQTNTSKEDATMKAADAVVSTATGSQHLSWEEREKAGPAIHYMFGSLIGAIYGGLAELRPGARSGFGTTFGSVLFTGADLIAVPILKLGLHPWSSRLELKSPLGRLISFMA
jgi:putative membrane protein